MIDGPVLVTGATGFIGRRLVGALAAKGMTVTGWTRALGDLTDREAVARVMTTRQPSVIFHLAAGSATLATADWTVPADEVRMLSNLAEAMPRGTILIHCGSMAEYGRSGRLSESDICRPNSAYGFAKAAASDRALAMAALCGFDIRVARLFGVYGPGEAEQRLLPYLLAHLRAKRPVPLSDGEQIRDFIHVDDVCDRLMALAAAPSAPQRLVNVGTGVGVSVAEVCRAVAAALGADPRLLQFGAQSRRLVDEDQLVACTERLATLGPVPRQRWRDPADMIAAMVGEMIGNG